MKASESVIHPPSGICGRVITHRKTTIGAERGIPLEITSPLGDFCRVLYPVVPLDTWLSQFPKAERPAIIEELGIDLEDE